MTNEETKLSIDYLKDMQEEYIEVEGYERHPLPEWYALDYAIKVLEQQPCEDCISREAVFDFIRSLPRWCVKSEDGKFNNVGLLYDDVMFGIDKLPSVTPKEKTGHRRLINSEWIDFLSEQFDISRTSAKEMLHAMMSVKKEDNIKKQFSQGKKGFSQGFSQG